MTDGMDELRARMERGSRTVPPPRHPRPGRPEAPTVTPERDAPSEGNAPLSTPEAESERVLQLTDVGERWPDLVDGNTGETLALGGSPSPAQAGEVQPRLQPGDVTESNLPEADEPLANLNVRVRVSLNERVDDLVYELRKQGVRTSKAELIESLLASLPPHPTAPLTERLCRFRRLAPRRP